MLEADAARVPEGARGEHRDAELLRRNAEEVARRLAWNPGIAKSDFFSARWQAMSAVLKPVLEKVGRVPRDRSDPDDIHWLRDNTPLLWAELGNTKNAFKRLRRLPQVRTPKGITVPRTAAVAEAFLYAANFDFDEAGFVAYLSAFQESTVLKYQELWALIPAMELALLEQIAARGRKLLESLETKQSIGVCVRSLREISHAHWKEILEPQIAFDKILREDPAGAYTQMDFASRNFYREKLVKIAERCDFTETEVAHEALTLAHNAQQRKFEDPRQAERQSHVGYYLIGQGAVELRNRIMFRPNLPARVRSFLRAHPDEFYLPGVEVLSFSIMSAIVLVLTNTATAPGLILFSMLVLLLPCSQAAVQLMNYLTTTLLRPEILPKLDFSKSIPTTCTTLVAVPALLLNDKQVRRLAQDLEVRFLGNHDKNLHFALLTDLPDSPVPAPDDDPLVDLCAELIKGLNEKYSGRQMGSFLMLHRHRVYNSREKVWMGWERKRGKLMDLNRFLTGNYDSFPVKAGDLSVLPNVRFVITLDADTELPRGSAQRLIGTLAHPLNQAIIDPEKNIVIAGYAILQPRVRISVQSASRSRLANIYSGQTGFDIYTRAVSDVYQDLYGEGIFAGKGIYEVATVHRVLDRRFPQNALLSHDLIEGAYARVGLVTDTEVIEDYPSHYSAFNRRKHRWLRGDWQITSWLFSRVPDETGRLVPNPISLVSQWKILDNLRRSLVEPATFLLFVLGWLVLPGSPRAWTIAAVCILVVPVWFEFLFTIVRSVAEQKMGVAKEALSTLFSANISVLLSIIFLPHQMLVSLDAVVRTIIRRMVTRQRLLEWETAAEAEAGGAKRTPVDRYLNWMPIIAIVLGIIIFYLRRPAFEAALPILILWAASKLVSTWLNRPPRLSRSEVSDKDELFLRRAAIFTWRYFAEFSTEKNNWLIPDNLQEEPYRIAERVSPTNIGLLLNARQVACEFGHLTPFELADLTGRTLTTIHRMKRFRGHLYNWYDTQTLEPLPPLFVSSVDSGNLVASLWTLQQGCLRMIEAPMLRPEMLRGFVDFLQVLTELKLFPKRVLSQLEKRSNVEGWEQAMLKFPLAALDRIEQRAAAENVADAKWFCEEARQRFRQFQRLVVRLTPWMLPDFEELRSQLGLEFLPAEVSLKRLPQALSALEVKLQSAVDQAEAEKGPDERRGLLQRLLSMVSGARMDSAQLVQQLDAVAADATRIADEMDFGFLWNPKRKLLSIGYESEKGRIHDACYDLLASESRTATFVAVANDQVPQETWFLLARTHIMDHGRPVLLSWTGTMFEYLMPALWMRTYPNTLLDRSRHAAVRTQQEFTALERVPWGISECAYSVRDDAGNYQYHAFGIPRLALHKADIEALVISPYSTFLALGTAPPQALKNLRKMERQRWFGRYGFFESADYSAAKQRAWRHNYEITRCWMAHHQGMSLLAMANFLADDIVQEWFHCDPRVQATELLLHEKPVNYIPAAVSA